MTLAPKKGKHKEEGSNKQCVQHRQAAKERSKEESSACLAVSSEMQIHVIVCKRELRALLPVKGNFQNLKIMFMKQKGERKIFAKSGALFRKEGSH